MQYKNNTNGQSLIEILFAIAIFTIGVVTIGYLIFDSFASLRYAEDMLQARLIAQEGMEVARVLRDSSFDVLPIGTYGLVFDEGNWMFVDTPDTKGIFTHSIVISEVDAEIRAVEVVVTWERRGEVRSFTLRTRFSNWKGTAGMAHHIVVDADNRIRTSSSTVLEGIVLGNQGDEDSVVTNLMLQWESEATLESVSLKGVYVYSASSSPVQSSVVFAIDPYTIDAYSDDHAVAFTFSESIASTDVLATFIFADGSHKHIVLEDIP